MGRYFVTSGSVATLQGVGLVTWHVEPIDRKPYTKKYIKYLPCAAANNLKKLPAGPGVPEEHAGSSNTASASMKALAECALRVVVRMTTYSGVVSPMTAYWRCAVLGGAGGLGAECAGLLL